jgi:S-adenosylmethionine uptake transporter
LPDGEAFLAIGAASFLTVCGAAVLGWAYAREEAQVLVPMEYSGFLWAALFGWLFFAETVTPTVLAGTALIVIGCAIATRRDVPARST